MPYGVSLAHMHYYCHRYDYPQALNLESLIVFNCHQRLLTNDTSQPWELLFFHHLQIPPVVDLGFKRNAALLYKGTLKRSREKTSLNYHMIG